MKSNYTKISSITVAFCLINVCLFASHPCDKAGDAPTADIAAAGPIVVDGDNIVAVGAQIIFSTEPVDNDIHKDATESEGTTVRDTFDQSGAIEWKEKNGSGTFSSTTDKTVTYTADEAGDIEIELRIKDDGSHYKDFTKLTLVKTYKAKAVNPDGVKINSQPVYIVTSPSIVYSLVEWQVTYKGVNLPWVGKLAETIAPCLGFGTIKTLPFIYAASNSWSAWLTGGSFSVSTSPSGTLTDIHMAAVPSNINVGHYYEISAGQGIAWQDAVTSAFNSIGTFVSWFYLERATSTSGLHAVHNEH